MVTRGNGAIRWIPVVGRRREEPLRTKTEHLELGKARFCSIERRSFVLSRTILSFTLMNDGFHAMQFQREFRPFFFFPIIDRYI